MAHFGSPPEIRAKQTYGHMDLGLGAPVALATLIIVTFQLASAIVVVGALPSIRPVQKISWSGKI
jgi:hypothetical protein